MAPNVIDLCTVDDVATWGNMPSAQGMSPDPKMVTKIQEAITGWSQFVMWRTGRDPNYYTGTEGDFSVFQETRDGNDADSMGVLNGPIQSMMSVQINGSVIPQSLVWNQFGWFIEQNNSFVGLRTGTGAVSGSPWGGPYRTFRRGKGNVFLAYKGGYNGVPADLFEASLRAVTIAVSRSLREDESGRTTPQTGAVTSYKTYPWDKDMVQRLANYTRTMLSFGS